ncbi:MAG TPA: AsmA family protein [Stellaceae bacterium]|jgi:AsmA protein|nr:AsmA family protein [Stellaceae bacterium]
MLKLLKWIGIVVVVLVVLVVGAAVVLPQFISVDTYKDRLVAEVKSATGRDLKISGPVHLSVLPHLAIDAAQVSFSNAAGGQSKDMMTLGSLQVELELFPLINKTVVVDRFVLKDPVIALEVDKQGRPNWDFSAAKAPGAAAAAGSATAPAKPAAGGGADMSALRLGDVRLENGTISYLDQRTGQRTVIEKINSSVSLPDINSPFKVDGSLQYNSVELKLKLNVDKTSDFITRQGSGVEASVSSDVMNFDFKGKGAAALPASASGTIDLKVPSVRKLAAWGGAPMPQGEGFGPLAIAGKLEMTGNEIKFDDAQLSLDAIKGKGSLALNTGGAKPDVKGSLDLEALNVNPYLPPEKGGAPAASTPAAGAKPAAGSGWSDEPIDVSALKTANVDFQLSANAIQFRKIKIDKSSITLRLKDGHLATDLTQLTTYGGGGKATVTLDGSGAEPALTVVANMSGIDVDKLLIDAIDLDKLTGRGSLEVSLAGKGKSQRQLISSLNGKGAFNVANGEIKGLDLLKMLNMAATNVANLASLGGGGNTTPFSHLAGTWTMTNGIMKNNDLVLDSPGLKAEGAGTVDLPTRHVDYKVTPKVVGLGVPVLIQGPWDNLSYLPDLAGLVQGGVGGAVNIIKGGAGGVTDTVKSIVPGLGGSSSSSGTSSGSKSGSGSSSGSSNPLKSLFGN